jgi:hypothetical protein
LTFTYCGLAEPSNIIYKGKLGCTQYGDSNFPPETLVAEYSCPATTIQAKRIFLGLVLRRDATFLVRSSRRLAIAVLSPEYLIELQR